jgi:hypothetical protein
MPLGQCRRHREDEQRRHHSWSVHVAPAQHAAAPPQQAQAQSSPQVHSPPSAQPQPATQQQLPQAHSGPQVHSSPWRQPQSAQEHPSHEQTAATGARASAIGAAPSVRGVVRASVIIAI